MLMMRVRSSAWSQPRHNFEGETVLVTIELLERDSAGWLAGSRREVLLGVANTLVNRGLAKVVDPNPRPPETEGQAQCRHHGRYSGRPRPTTRPVSLLEVKRNLRLSVDDTTLDSDLTEAIDAAVEQIEQDTGHVPIASVYTYYRDRLPAGAISLPKRPVQTVDAFNLLDDAGAPQLVDPAGLLARSGTPRGLPDDRPIMARVHAAEKRGRCRVYGRLHRPHKYEPSDQAGDLAPGRQVVRRSGNGIQQG